MARHDLNEEYDNLLDFVHERIQRRLRLGLSPTDKDLGLLLKVLSQMGELERRLPRANTPVENVKPPEPLPPADDPGVVKIKEAVPSPIERSRLAEVILRACRVAELEERLEASEAKAN